MSRPPTEVADIFAAHAHAFLEACRGVVSSAKKRVVRNVVACRTAVLGGHVDRCNDCGWERIAYNSCRNRHCPKCQRLNQERWLLKRERAQGKEV